MTELKLKTFPATREIPLGCYADAVLSVTYDVDGERVTHHPRLCYVRDEGKNSVVRDAAGRP